MRTLWLGLILVACTGEPEETLDSGLEPTTASQQVQTGPELFALGCAGCHGEDGRGGTGGPDLRNVAADLSVEEIADVVRFGTPFMDPVPFDEVQAQTVAEFVVEVVLTQDQQ